MSGNITPVLSTAIIFRIEKKAEYLNRFICTSIMKESTFKRLKSYINNFINILNVDTICP